MPLSPATLLPAVFDSFRRHDYYAAGLIVTPHVMLTPPAIADAARAGVAVQPRLP